MQEDPGRSDTTMLLRLDPDRNAIAVMSIPRDLKVEIPGYGTGKFNEAYAYGGPKLTLQTVKQLTGLPINHVVNVDFLGFVRAVYAIGCVYVDVDRRYFHSNVGVPASEQYAEINVQPGYQLLCGKKALQYVRYRHTDTDLVRSARQQDFISAARQRISVQDLVFDQSGLIDIFTKYTTSDINDKETMLQVLKLFLASRNAAIKEVHFPAELGPSFVYTTPEAVNEAVNMFLGIEASGGSRGSLEDGEGGSGGKGKKKGGKKGKKQEEGQARKAAARKAEAAGQRRPGAGARSGRTRGEVGGAQARLAASPSSTRADCPSGAYYAESNSYEHVQDPRVYHLKDTDDERHAAYRMVGVAGTRRRHPLLRGPGDPGLVGPADPRQPEPDQDHSRPRVRHLRRRRSGQNDRLAPRRQQLLDLQRPAADPDQRSDGRDGPLRRRDHSRRKSRSRGGRRDERAARAGRGDRSRLGGPGDRRLLRRARPPGDRPRHPPGEGRLALPRRGDDPRARASRSWSAATPSASPSPPTWRSCSARARLLFVCVDTPPTYSGDADLSRVRAVVEELPEGSDHVLIMKSTVPAGTGEAIRRDLPGLSYVSCPEFLKEGTAVADFMHPDRVVVGADPGDEEAAAAVAGLYEPLAARSSTPTSPAPR